MRTCGLSHQIMGPTTVKMAKTGFMRKIDNLQLDVPYFDMIVHKCACEKSYISIITTPIIQASLKYLQEPATILGPQNRTQGRCDQYQCSLFYFSRIDVFTLFIGDNLDFHFLKFGGRRTFRCDPPTNHCCQLVG